MLSAQEETWLMKMASTGTLLALDELHACFEEALNRWQQFQGVRPASWTPVLGWIKIAGRFEMPKRALEILAACPPERRPRVATAYLAWNRDALTHMHANPYEPLIEFFHHGGTWSRPENGILDIYDGHGAKCGILINWPKK